MQTMHCEFDEPHIDECNADEFSVAANGFKNFFPTVIETLGFNKTITLVLTCPRSFFPFHPRPPLPNTMPKAYLIAAILTIPYSLSSGHYNERTWHIIGSKAVAITGFILAAATLNTGVRYFAMCIFTIGTYGVNSIILGWVGTVCSQTPEKRAIAIAMATTASNSSFIWTPYLFPKSDEPRCVLFPSPIKWVRLMRWLF